MKSQFLRSPYVVAISFFLVFLIAFGGFLGLVVLIQEDRNSDKPTFETFRNCNDLASYINENYRSPIYYYDDIVNRESISENAPGLGNSDSVDYSQTNVQVEGVDEADSVKTNGKQIFTFDQNKQLVIIDAETLEIESKTFLEFTPSSMFIDDNRVIVFGNDVYYWNNKLGNEETIVAIYNFTDLTSPKLEKTITLQGYYNSARMTDGYVYFVNNLYVYDLDGKLTGEEVDQYIPRYLVEDPGARNSTESKVDCSEISHFGDNVNNFVTVAAINPENGSVNTKVILGNADNLYASKNNLYLTTTFSEERREEPVPLRVGITEPRPEEPTVYSTGIFKLKLSEGNIEFVSSGSVEGTILNQFSMDEYYGTFRLVTTISTNFRNTNNALYILNEDLEEESSIKDIAKGESVYSVRFMGDRAFVVTFRQIDPLFAIDLSDPKNPEIKGELKISGYSSYLHPLDANHIIGVGKEVNEKTGSEEGLKFTIFDVSDLNNPTEISSEVLEAGYSYTEVLNDHKAFLYEAKNNLIVLPVYYSDDIYYYDFYANSTGFDGFLALKISDDFGEIKLNEISATGKGFQSYGSSPRSFYIGDNLFTFKDGMLRKLNIETLEKLNEVEVYKSSFR